jgi:hypothetical protein
LRAEHEAAQGKEDFDRSDRDDLGDGRCILDIIHEKMRDHDGERRHAAQKVERFDTLGGVVLAAAHSDDASFATLPRQMPIGKLMAKIFKLCNVRNAVVEGTSCTDAPK